MYFEIIPNSALELALWLESDRMGYMLPTVTYDAFQNQQQVVSEKTNYNNQPYGQTSYLIGKLLYPEGHPYNWTTIGALEDLQNATLEKTFMIFIQNGTDLIMLHLWLQAILMLSKQKNGLKNILVK